MFESSFLTNTIPAHPHLHPRHHILQSKAITIDTINVGTKGASLIISNEMDMPT